MSAVQSYLGECTDCFAAFGAVVAAYIGLKLLASLWDGIKCFVLSRQLGLALSPQKLGSWAVVTGATDGIGKAYAEELARRGMKIALISRNPDKLSDVAKEISSKYNVETETVAVDFTGGPEIYSKISAALAGKEIGVLVNNVGLGYEHPMYLGEIQGDETIRNMVIVNCLAVAEMSRIVISGMVERRKGAIINISSASGIKPTSLLTVYSATKVYVDTFSHALQAEYKSKGVTVQCVMPYFVATKLSGIRRTSFFIPNPMTYVRAALGTLGLQDRSYGCMSHAMQAYLVERLPQSVYNKLSNGRLLAVRKKALAKKQKSS